MYLSFTVCASYCVRARTPPEPTLRTRLRQNDYVLGLGVNDPIGAAFVLHAHAPAAPGSLLGLDQPDRRVERVVAQPDELNTRPFVPNRMRMERSRIKTRAMRGVPRTCALEIKLAEWAPAQVASQACGCTRVGPAANLRTARDFHE